MADLMGARSDPPVITGLGVVCAAGAGVESLERTLSRRERQLFPLRRGVGDGLAVTEGGQIPEAVASARGGCDLALTACSLAMEEALTGAGLDRGARPASLRIGLSLGTALGAIERGEATFREARARRLSEESLRRGGLREIAPHVLSHRLAARHGLKGPVTSFSATCVSSLYALEQACLDLAFSRADAVLCGGFDRLTRFMQAGFCSLGALAPPERSAGGGMLLGEASAFVMLEPWSLARARRARVFGVVAGRALRCDTKHLTSPDEEGRGMLAAIRRALEEARRGPEDVRWVSVTAAGSPMYGRMYENILPEIFAGRRPAVVTWEDTVGHVLAASGVFGLAHAALVMGGRAGWIRESAGTEEEAPRDFLALTVGFGGQSGATLIAHPDRFLECESEAPSVAAAGNPRQARSGCGQKRIVLAGRGVARARPVDLEDHFPGRWDPRRSIRDEVGVLVNAISSAAEAAGWWRRGSGDAVRGGVVIGTDLQSFEAAARFGRRLDEGPDRVLPSDFLFALPSSVTAVVGLLFGLEDYQATVTGHGLSGFQAVAHAVDLLRAGRLHRVLAGALTMVGPRVLEVLRHLELADASNDPFILAVAWCLEARESSQVERGACEIEECVVGNAARGKVEYGPHARAVDTREVLAGIPASYRSLAGPSLLAVDRVVEATGAGEATTVVHRDPCFGRVGRLRVKPESRIRRDVQAWRRRLRRRA